MSENSAREIGFSRGLMSNMNRRELLERAAALGLGMSALVAIDQAAIGGVLAQSSAMPVIILDGEPNNLQPIMASSRVTFTVLDEVNGFLARYDEKFTVTPALATSWEYVDDKTMRFHLRGNVKFHNGTTMTADDVKFSIEAHLDPAQASPIRARLDAVDHVEVVDASTVVIHLKAPYAPLLDVLIDRVPIIPRAVYGTAGAAKEAPVGCGPFKFGEWKKSSSITLTKFADYWETGFPKTDGLQFLFLPEYNSAKSSLLSKQGDALLQLNLADVASLQAQQGLVVDSVLLLGFWWVGMNVNRAPFTDKRVRQAIKYVLNRQQVLDYVLAGHGAAAVVPIPKTSPFYSAELEYAQNADKARQLLADAGFASGLKLTLTVPKTPEEEPMGVVLQGQLKDIGVSVDLEVLEVPAFIERIFTNKDFQFQIVGDTAGPDPASLLNSYYMSDSPSNIQGYKNADVDALLKKATATTDVPTRKDLYKQALTIALDDAPMVWIAEAERASAYWDYLAGFVNLPTLRYEFWRLNFARSK